jgi:hypothetical protein
LTQEPANILVLGASYGLLPGVKLSLAGHRVTFVSRAGEAIRMRETGLSVRIPLRRNGKIIELRAAVEAEAAPAVAAFRTPEEVDPANYDIVVLAMQEPQFAAPELVALLGKIGRSGLPCLSIMNLPPPPFMARLGDYPGELFEGVYGSSQAWQGASDLRLTLASPDPQAVRKDPDRPGELTVTLPSNFKAAPFELAEDQALLERLARDMSQLKVKDRDAEVRPPVMLRAHSSLHVPLAKWPMLLAGNCRCLVSEGGIQSIADAVHGDLEASEAIYRLVCDLALSMGASEADLVPFNSYAKAATGLSSPSSAARALAAGATAIERIDLLVLRLLEHHGFGAEAITPIVAEIERRLAENSA